MNCTVDIDVFRQHNTQLKYPNQNQLKMEIARCGLSRDELIAHQKKADGTPLHYLDECPVCLHRGFVQTILVIDHPPQNQSKYLTPMELSYK